MVTDDVEGFSWAIARLFWWIISQASHQHGNFWYHALTGRVSQHFSYIFLRHIEIEFLEDIAKLNAHLYFVWNLKVPQAVLVSI